MNYLSCFSADRGKRGSRGSRVSRRWRFPGRSGGVIRGGGALFLVYLFLFCRRLAADPFASQTSTRAVRVTPLRNPQLRMNLQGRAPQESATADEPPLQRGLTTSCPWSWPLGTAPQLRLQRPGPCRCPVWRPFPGELCPPKERSGELPAPTSAGQRASA